MNWVRLIAIVVGTGAVTSLTDWLFAGDWIHRRYTYPEIWRQGAEGRAIALTSPLPFLTCGVFAYVAARLGLRSVAGAVKLCSGGVVDGAAAADPDERGVHEAAPGVCDVLRGGMVDQALDHRAGGGLVPSLMPICYRCDPGFAFGLRTADSGCG